MTKNLQTTIKATLKITQYHNTTAKPKKLTKNGFIKPHVNTKFRSLTEIFFTPQFLGSLENSGMKKNTLFSLPSSLFFSTQATVKFFTRFISCFKIHSKKT